MLFLIIDFIIVGIAVWFPGTAAIPHYRFLEKQWITTVSLIKLLIASILSLASYVVLKFSSSKHGGAFWLIASLGLLFLGIDEWYYLRERAAGYLQRPDLMEPLMALIYFIIAVLVIMTFFKNLKDFKDAFIFMVGGILLFGLKIITGLAHVYVGAVMAYIIGGSLKIFGETLIIVGFLNGLLLNVHFCIGDKEESGDT